jgi:peptide deformylase
MVLIVEKDAPVLREKARAVLKADFGSAKLHSILTRMREAVDSQEDGVAIAAPQIGESLRIFLVSRKILKKGPDDNPKDLVCINPELLKLSKKKEPMDEGCLSMRWLYGEVDRSTKATIRAYDEEGRRFTRGASGLLAQVFQHENDHLDGILFTDKARNVRELPPKKHAPQTI